MISIIKVDKNEGILKPSYKKYNPLTGFKVLLFLAVILIPNSAVGKQKAMQLVCDHWPPYQILENDNVSGFSVSLVKQVLQRMDVQVTDIKAYPWKRALNYLKNGKADALFSANFNPERTAFAYYPDQMLIDSPWVLWGKRSKAIPFLSYKDLSDKRIGLVSGYTYTKSFWSFVKTHGNYDSVTSDEQNFRKLAAGRVDYVVAELGNGYYLLNKLNLSGIVPFPKAPVKAGGLYIIFSKKNVSKEFVDRFSKTLFQIKSEPGYKSLYAAYFFLPRQNN